MNLVRILGKDLRLRGFLVSIKKILKAIYGILISSGWEKADYAPGFGYNQYPIDIWLGDRESEYRIDNFNDGLELTLEQPDPEPSNKSCFSSSAKLLLFTFGLSIGIWGLINLLG